MAFDKSKENFQDDFLIEPMMGLMHSYDPLNRLTALESGNLHSDSTVIFIPGLGDGFSAVPYLNKLALSLEEIQFSLTQILLSSSYNGFGFSSLDNDIIELKKCLRYLRKIGKKRFVLLGHSTGCQDIIKYFNSFHQASDPINYQIIGAILQAPVSDREYIIETLGHQNHQLSINAAKKLIESHSANAPIPSEFSDMFSGGKCTISASRWLSLAESLTVHPNGEDYFSSDLPTELLTNTLSGVGRAGTPAMVLISGSDETMPESVDKDSFLQNLVNALTQSNRPNQEWLRSICQTWSAVLPKASHCAEEAEDELCDRIINFIQASLNNLQA
ncbi:hypothetical protein O181_041255 [Austropuccinia psidii MF-1]|uniref:Uncharacterized protein n=1 Tax=Austropuccinia psidii MF-1 TaxID=1389203 RepID=A0A9Q3DEI8_9BASI|nr:hypothetical protein [Austropuccinia psidii MF-1]